MHTGFLFSQVPCHYSCRKHAKRIYELAAADSPFPPQLLVRIVSHVLHDFFQPQPGLLCSWDNLAGWQEETVATRVSQLKGERVFDAIIVAPVNAAAAGLV